jgi:tetratricopeptide (TPR) repeat protein
VVEVNADRDLASVPTADSPESLAQTLRQTAFDQYRAGDYPRAITNFETASWIAPQTMGTWPKYILYYCYMVTGRYREALALANSLVKADPYQAISYQQVGLAQLWLGQAPAALESFQRALEFDSHAPRIHFYVGLAHSQMKQLPKRDVAFTQGVKEYEEILKRNPTDFSANYELASLLLFWNQDLARASLCLDQAKKSFPGDPEAELEADHKLFVNYYLPLLEGILLYRKGNTPTAQQTLLKALANLPSNSKADVAELYFYLGKTYADLGNQDTAKSFLENGLNSDPAGPYAGDTTKIIRGLASH